MNSLFNKDLWKEILQSITSNGFRTIITSFGVFWGVFILILLLCASNGLKNGIENSFSGISTNSIFIWAQGVSMEYKGLPKNREYNFKMQDAQAIRNNIKGLKTVSPRNQLGGWGVSNTITHNLNEGSFTVMADFPEILEQKSLIMEQGRFINYNDIEHNKKNVVIGWAIIDELYEKGEEVIGSYIKIQGVSFKVVGVYKDISMQGKRQIEEQKYIHVPFSTFTQVFNEGDKVRFFHITANDNQSISEIKESIFSLLRKRHSIHPKDDRAIGNFDLNKFFTKFGMLFLTLKIVSYFVGILILFSGIIGISNIMLIVIKERTNEIGVRRALGATPGNIRKQILLESLFLTIISGMTGVSLAALISYLINLQLDSQDPATSESLLYNPSVDLVTIITVLIILVISGLIAGFIPAQTAIKIKPIEALRTE
ncbi:ABC transporter permease [Aquimarina agarilytica]|uniref:ABC transporter permease n=1 Tax=Aquimarina agarilytica TaxID=1087449 RepID=UPI0002880775|nr:ABC transporter permease [Aquimarina agarilytica]